MTSLTLIGYWRATGDFSSDYPDPRDWIDLDWDEGERSTAAWYFSSGTLFRASLGRSQCRICGTNNGAVEYTDGTYVWPQGLAHYIDEHAVRLPQALIAHAVERVVAVADLEAVPDWWLSATQKNE